MKKVVIFGGVSLVAGVVAGVYANFGFGIIVAVAIFSMLSIFIRDKKKKEKSDSEFIVN